MRPSRLRQFAQLAPPLVLAAVLAAACAPPAVTSLSDLDSTTSAPTTSTTRAVTTAPPTTAPPPPPTTTTAPPATSAPPPAPTDVVEVRYRPEVLSADPALADFPTVLDATLNDPRGWTRAGYRFVAALDAPYRIVLAEGGDVDRLCLPYETNGRWSCQNGPVVALNADRWRSASPKWTGDLAGYRQMLVNHEVGHLLGMNHMRCRQPGTIAAVMVQQSSELNGCLANPWPLEQELAVAATHRPLAPPFARGIEVRDQVPVPPPSTPGTGRVAPAD